MESTTPRAGERYLLHAVLFLATAVCTTYAGVAWRGGDPLKLEQFGAGVPYSCFLLSFLTAHEFGHYLAAKFHAVKVTLPFYLPFPGAWLGIEPSFGTLGAVIRIRSRIPTSHALFDIAVAGPLAGFVVSLATLIIGFHTLPGIEYLQAIHPGYPGSSGGTPLFFGKSILYTLLENLAPQGSYLPPMSEMYHYPLLAAGWFGLFVTSLNLLPVGQLDGGHLTLSMFGQNTHRVLGRVTQVALFLISLPAIVLDLSSAGLFVLPTWWVSIVVPGGSAWLLWALIVTFIIRTRHPSTLSVGPLDSRRMALGYLTIVIFLLTVMPSPLVVK